MTVSDSTNVEVAKSISGDVELSGAMPEARLTASTVSGRVRVRDVKARGLSLSAISGDVDVTNVEAERLDGKSVSGDFVFVGTVARNARYEFSSHSGSVRLTLGGGTGFEVSANTFSGNIQSDLPVTVNDQRPRRGPGRSVRAVVGDGGASLTVSTFSGDIVIRKQ